MLQNNKLFVVNLDYQVDSEDLQNLFSQFGRIIEIKIPTDRETGRKRGFAFISFETPKSAELALAMNGKELQGRTLRVEIAKDLRKSIAR